MVRLREQIRLSPLEIGARVGLSIDLDAKRASFRLDLHGRISTVDCDFSQLVGEGPVSGYFGAVVKHLEVGLELEAPSWSVANQPAKPAAGVVEDGRNTMQRAPDAARTK